MALESFNRQEIIDEVNDQLNNLRNPQAVTFPGTNEVINGNGQAPTEKKEDSPETKELKDTIKQNLNISDGDKIRSSCIDEIIGKDTLDSIKKKGDIEKAKIAQNLACLMILEDGDLRELQKKLDSGTKITPEKLGVSSWTDLQNLFDRAQEFLKKKTQELFYLFGGNTMPGITYLATGDGSLTKGIGGKDNLGRIFFDYPNLSESNNFEKLTLNENYFTFNNRNKDATIDISATGFNQGGGGRIKLVFVEPLTLAEEKEGKKPKEYKVTWNYKEDGLVGPIIRPQLPKAGNRSIKILQNDGNPRISIPKEFVDWKIMINTESKYFNEDDGLLVAMQKAWKKYADEKDMNVDDLSSAERNRAWAKYKTYDEVNFNVITENGGIAKVPPIGEAFKKSGYEITPIAANKLLKGLSKVNRDENKQRKLSIINSNEGYYFSSDNDAKNKLNELKTAGTNLYDNIINSVSNLSETEKNTFKTNLDALKDSIYNEIQNKVASEKRYQGNEEVQMTDMAKKAQIQLAMNRFLSVMAVFIKDKNFMKEMTTNNITNKLRTQFIVSYNKTRGIKFESE